MNCRAGAVNYPQNRIGHGPGRIGHTRQPQQNLERGDKDDQRRHRLRKLDQVVPGENHALARVCPLRRGGGVAKAL